MIEYILIYRNDLGLKITWTKDPTIPRNQMKIGPNAKLIGLIPVNEGYARETRDRLVGHLFEKHIQNCIFNCTIKDILKYYGYIVEYFKGKCTVPFAIHPYQDKNILLPTYDFT